MTKYNESLIQKLEAEKYTSRDWRINSHIFSGFNNGLETAIRIIRSHTATPDVEHVAKAIHASTISERFTWECCDKEPYIRQAKAAIATMGSDQSEDRRTATDGVRVPTDPAQASEILGPTTTEQVFDIIEKHQHYWDAAVEIAVLLGTRKPVSNNHASILLQARVAIDFIMRYLPDGCNAAEDDGYKAIAAIDRALGEKHVD